MSNKNKTWLIKDQGFVTGPFNQEEVEEQLKTSQLSPFATARKPGQALWGFLAGHPEFAQFMDSTKLTQSSSTTTTSWTSLFTKTKETELNTAPQSPPNTQTEEQSVPYQVISSTPQKPNKQIPGVFLVISAFIIVSLLAGVGYYLFVQQDSKTTKAELKSDDEGQAWFLAGHYNRAFTIWQKKAPPPPYKKQLKILKFQLKNDISMIDPLLKETKGEIRDLIQALTQLKSGDLTRARQGLTKLIRESSQKEVKQSAFANMALLSAKEKKCSFFKEHALAEFGHQSLIHFLFAFCLLPSSSLEDREQAKALLTPITKKQQSYYQEALLGLAYIQVEEGNLNPDFIQNLLDSDPYLTNNHYYPVFIDRNVYSWPQFLPLCKKIYSTKEHHHLFISLEAYCLSKAQLYEQALNSIKKAEQSDPESALIKSLHAHILDSIRLKNESARVLGYALKFNLQNQYVLPYILQARFCEQNQDWACASKNWLSVIRHNPHSLSGLGGIAYAKYKQGHFQEAKEYMNQGLSISEGAVFSPLLYLQRYFHNTTSEVEEASTQTSRS